MPKFDLNLCIAYFNRMHLYLPRCPSCCRTLWRSAWPTPSYCPGSPAPRWRTRSAWLSQESGRVFSLLSTSALLTLVILSALKLYSPCPDRAVLQRYHHLSRTMSSYKIISRWQISRISMNTWRKLVMEHLDEKFTESKEAIVAH